MLLKCRQMVRPTDFSPYHAFDVCLSFKGVPPVLTLNNRIFCEFNDIANLIELKVT
jgi:hypothetical protein